MYQSRKYSRDRSRTNKVAKIWRDKNPDKVKVYRQRHRQSAERKRDSNYRRVYGITYLDVFEMWVSQERRCKCCSEEIRFPHPKTHVDHCHKTKVVRGLICARCNALIGYADDSIDLLRRAISYLT